jgi:lipopolysaccharide transport system ATP-binding protein
MPAAIRVENLSKRYLIAHERQERYTALRDVLARQASAALRFWSHRGGSARKRDEFWALRDVNCQIEAGESVGIIGRNGAGKSTFLKVLSRITEPTGGRVRIKGRVATLLEVGTGFHPELTGRENIFLNGAILGMSKSQIRSTFDEIVSFAEVEKFLDTPVKHYSSGMYMRLAFAVAAHVDPEILIVDEVLAVGDAQFQKKCLGKMSSVASSGRTVLFVSHNIGAISALCSKAIYLKSGKVAEAGPTESVIRRYMEEQSREGAEDLASLRRRGYGREARFKAASLISAHGNSIHFGDPLVVSLTVESDLDLDGLSVGCSIFNSNGACVGSAVQEGTFSVTPTTPVRVGLSIDHVQLVPGSYYMAFGLSRGIHQNLLDAISGYPSFQILPSSGIGAAALSWHPSWGDTIFAGARFQIAKN